MEVSLSVNMMLGRKILLKVLCHGMNDNILSLARTKTRLAMNNTLQLELMNRPTRRLLPLLPCLRRGLEDTAAAYSL